ncbi:YcxB family protein [Paenibacillus antarcticus]|uniref:YcxB-like C-terminal domain-containing protein n=1 Tax=Paenibacillus antarcticus TaxID=253703 RepID=A0A168MWH7_9BACL|nr:YcxB family protein [Paenibacillus antarcticus]OAB45130.1 hypothetical protein PBAT_14415 [Paenibacillus antarcticus]
MVSELTFKTKLKLENVIEYNNSFSKNRRIYLTVLFFVGMFVILFLTEQEKSNNIATMLIIDFIGSIIIWFLIKFRIKSHSKKTFQSDNLAQQEYTYTINELGLRFESESSNGNIKWADVKKVSETKNLYLVFISSNKSFVMPKSSISSAKERLTLKYLISLNLDSKKVQFRT